MLVFFRIAFEIQKKGIGDLGIAGTKLGKSC